MEIELKEPLDVYGYKYPIDKMQVGDFFRVRCETREAAVKYRAKVIERVNKNKTFKQEFKSTLQGNGFIVTRVG